MIRSLTRLLASRYRPRDQHSKLVAILVPGSAKSDIDSDERISLRHLHHFLGKYDKYLIAPKGKGFRLDGLQTVEVDPQFFGSAQAYGRLHYRPLLYQIFRDYRYVFIYHLDALVFRDELTEWCGRGFDYIGAPWLVCEDTPWVKEPGVGNGGFTLMKVSSALRVLYNRYSSEPLKYWEDHFARGLGKARELIMPARKAMPRWMRGRATSPLRARLKFIDRVEANARGNDLFWAYSSRRYFPEFKIPDWRTALDFAFEAAPRRCFELTGDRLPFGCHAWTRFDRGFWKPFLLEGS